MKVSEIDLLREARERDMIANAGALDPAWLRMAFVFIAIGFGTKMGLAPMHSWKPDTYGEAPSLVGASKSHPKKAHAASIRGQLQRLGDQRSGRARRPQQHAERPGMEPR